MKNILIISTLFALAAVSAQAQGTISFQNTSITKIYTNAEVGGPAFSVTGTVSGGQPYRYALFCSTTATSVNGQTTAITGGSSLNYAFNDSHWTLVAYGTNFNTTGQFTSTKGSATTVPGVAGGSAAQFVVIGWSANIGTTITGVQNWFNGGNPAFNGWIGQSVVSGSITLGTGSPATLFGASAPDIQGFTLGLVAPPGSVPPVITSQPTSKTLPVGATASFSAGAYGTPSPACQWMFNSTNIIVGATNFTLTIGDVQLTNAGTYTAVITNTVGTTNSFAATLTVTAPSGTGYVIFADNSASMYTNSSVGGGLTNLTVAGGPAYYYALYASTYATSVDGQTSPIVGAASSSYAFSDTNWILVAYGTNSLWGRLISTSTNIPGLTPVSGIAGGTTAQFVVIGWSANVGTNIAAVEAWFNGGSPASDGWIGQSEVSGSIILGNGGIIPAPSLFGAVAPYIQGFILGLASPNEAAVYAVPYTPPAILQTSLNANGLQLSWPTASGSFDVQSAPSPAGPWSDTGWTVTSDGANSWVTATNVPPSQFYRLVAE